MYEIKVFFLNMVHGMPVTQLMFIRYYIDINIGCISPSMAFL